MKERLRDRSEIPGPLRFVIERWQTAGGWLQAHELIVVASAIVTVFVLALVLGDHSEAGPYNGLLASLFAVLSVLVAVVAGPWVGVSVAAVFGALHISFVLPFGHTDSLAAGIASMAVWMASSLLAGLTARAYRREAISRRREVEERQSLSDALNEIGSVVLSSLHEDEVVAEAGRRAGLAVAAESTMLVAYDGRRWLVEHAWGLLGDLAGREFAPEAEGVTGAIERLRDPVVACSDCRDGVQSAALSSLGVASSLVVPLFAHEEITGAVFLNSHSSAREWTTAEIAFARQASVDLSAALETMRLYRAQLRIATTLQEHFIHPLPHIEGLELGAVAEAAADPARVGGDFHDVVALAGRRVSLLIGDVEGNGVPAAGLTETVRSMVRALWVDSRSPGEVLTKVNRLLPGEGRDQHVTALLGLLDLGTGRLLLASAGHPPPIACEDGACRSLGLEFGPLLGAFDWAYDDVEARLSVGELLVCFTDGVIEARRDGVLFGERRLRALLQALSGASPQTVAEGVRAACREYAEVLQDDLQVLVVRTRAPFGERGRRGPVGGGDLGEGGETRKRE
jgi:hypothetical protein